MVGSYFLAYGVGSSAAFQERDVFLFRGDDYCIKSESGEAVADFNGKVTVIGIFAESSVWTAFARCI